MKLLLDKKNGLKVFILILLILLAKSPGFSQADEEPPVSPGFTLVTINQISGNTELIWTVSTSPDVAGYIIYIYRNRAGFAIDTIFNPAETNYSVYRPFSLIRSESFVVAAIDDSANVSPLSNVLNTIFCEAKIDTCNKKIKVTWNKYSSTPSKVTGYDILRSVNGGSYSLAGNVTATDTTFVSADFVNSTEYCFFIRAKLENGRFSNSNKSCVTVRTQKSPLWINGDYATVTSFDDISLAFTIDPTSETDLFSLERKVGATGSFEQIASIRTTIKSISYIDGDADPGKNNYYRLSSINSCNIPEIYSNTASNIVISAERGIGNDIIIKWNSYYKWNGMVSGYRLYMDTGNGFIQKAVTEASDTIYSLRIQDVMLTLTAENVCFFIIAEENSNPYGINGESKSNTACFAVEETITVPNIFTPNGDSKNDLFTPVLTFTPMDYYLVISDRQGRKVFETRDFTESWDGTDKNNGPRDGVYMWFIKAITNTGNKISRTGTVTIYKNNQ